MTKIIEFIIYMDYNDIEVSERRKMSDKIINWYVPKLTDSDEPWKKSVQHLFEEEAKTILERVNSNPLLKNVKAPDVIKENLWKQIRKHERKKVLY